MKKPYQVWHDKEWPQSHLDHSLGGHPAPIFPDDYIHVANVQANGLLETVELTNDKGGILDDSREWKPWEKNEGVEALVIAPRDTVAGDVIVDPDGRPFRMDPEGFRQIIGVRMTADGMRVAHADNVMTGYVTDGGVDPWQGLSREAKEADLLRSMGGDVPEADALRIVNEEIDRDIDDQLPVGDQFAALNKEWHADNAARQGGDSYDQHLNEAASRGNPKDPDRGPER